MTDKKESHKKRNFSFIFIFIVILTFTFKSINLIQIDTIYYVDVYKYIYDALEIAQNNNYLAYTSRGFPFIWLLSIFTKIFYPFINDPILISKILMLIINILFFLLFYLINKELFNEIIALFCTIFLLFEPAFMEYSLIAYLEPFSLLTGFFALLLFLKYLKSNKVYFFFLSICVSLISGLTRYEMFIIFTFPIFLVFILKELYQKKVKSVIFLMVGVISLVVILFPILTEYYSSITRFDPLTRFLYGFGNPPVLSNLFFSFSNISENLVLNLLFGLFSIFGFVLLVINYRKSKKFNFLTYAFIILFLMIAFISFGSYSYQIINESVIIFPLITIRQLMVFRLFFIPVFVYFIYQIILFFYSKLNKRIKKKTKLEKSFYGTLYELKNLTRKYWIQKFFRKEKNIKNLILILGLLSTNLIYIPILWEKGYSRIEENTEIMHLFKETGDWLETNLNMTEKVYLPFDYIFFLNNPSIKFNGLSYQLIWDEAGVNYDADITFDELESVRNVLINEINTSTDLKYLVVDWMNSIKFVFNLNISDQLYDLIYLTYEAKAVVNFYTHIIYIYQVS